MKKWYTFIVYEASKQIYKPPVVISTVVVKAHDEAEAASNFIHSEYHPRNFGHRGVYYEVYESAKLR